MGYIIYPFNKFVYGLNTKDPANEIPDGAASDSLNWLTTNGKIELARGYAPLGSELAGNGRVSGIVTGTKADGTEVPFRARAQKVEYYDSVLLDWVEIGSNILPVAANGEDITFAKYDSRAGPQVWLNSPNSGPKKILTANPGSYTDMYNSNTNYKAWLRVIGDRAYNWNITNTDRNRVRMSYIDTRGIADYTQISNEVIGTGNGANKTFSNTLTFKAGGSYRSCLDVSVTDSNETFSDTRLGTLTGSLGGTGTINYTTGAISVTFNTAPTNLASINATYRWVDETAASGIADFVVPGSRVSGDPNVFVQGTGGDIRNILTLKNNRYVAHDKSIYNIALSQDDTTTTNDIFRERLGIPYLRAAAETAEGIYAIDYDDDNTPRFVLIGFNAVSPEIRPTVLSGKLDLTSYTFTKAVVSIFADYILFECQSKNGQANDTTFVWNRIYKFFDKLDYAYSCTDIYNGTLISGDSISNNVYTLFSGLDVDGNVMNNYWISGISKLARLTPRGKAYPIWQLKKLKKISLEGEIGPDQTLHMYVSLDRGPFVEILDKTGGPFITGHGAYVDLGQRVVIGAPTLGRPELGGGTDGIEAYHYERIITPILDKFFEIQIKFAVSGVGYASVLNCQFRDIRLKQEKLALKYRV